eukprot:3650178-Pyramimonas_sp.AAC.1
MRLLGSAHGPREAHRRHLQARVDTSPWRHLLLPDGVHPKLASPQRSHAEPRDHVLGHPELIGALCDFLNRELEHVAWLRPQAHHRRGGRQVNRSWASQGPGSPASRFTSLASTISSNRPDFFFFTQQIPISKSRRGRNSTMSRLSRS